MKTFYVYFHKKASSGDIFYIGKGTGKRAWVKHNRTNFWKRVVEKHGLIVEIYKENLSNEEALSLEKEMISKYKDSACLCNLTDGGDGCSGFIWSDKSRRKISNLFKGKTKTEEHRRNLAKANLGKKQSPETLTKRKNTFDERKICKDQNTYVFFSDSDVFIGTRKELSLYTGIPTPKFVKLFMKNKRKSALGWSVLHFQELFFLGIY